MAVCQFFLRGACRYGDKCRLEHVRPAQSGFGSPGFASSANTANTIFGGDAGRRGFNQNRVGPPVQPAVAFTADSIRVDIHQERPIWKLSSYGPSKEEPCLVQGVDLSMEEARVRYYEDMKATGGTANYQAFINQATNSVEAIYAQIVKDPHNALQRAQQNKRDYEQTGKLPTSGNTSHLLPQQSAFLSPSRTAGGVGVFGQGGFGQSPSAPQSAFGPTQSVFGSSGTFRQPQTQTPQPTSAFPSAFGQTAFNQSPLQTPQTPQPFASTFPASPHNSAFGRTSTLSPQNSAFGIPSAFANDATQPGSQPSAFGNTSVFGNSNGSLGFGTSASVAAAPSFGSRVEPDVLSEMDLPPAERDAFLAPEFQMGCVPETPPPQSLRNGRVNANWNG